MPESQAKHKTTSSLSLTSEASKGSCLASPFLVCVFLDKSRDLIAAFNPRRCSFLSRASSD